MSEFVNIGIVGNVSAGKSTLLNALFGRTLAHVAPQRSTMLINHYVEGEGSDENSVHNTVKTTNEKFTDDAFASKKLPDGAKEQVHNVKPSSIAVKSCRFCVTDFPGMNDEQNEELYYTWLRQMSGDLDILLLVFDCNARGTSDEMKIIKEVFSCYKSNSEQGIATVVFILVNKFDRMELLKGKVVLDDEDQESFDFSRKRFNTAAKEVGIDMDKIFVFPISAKGWASRTSVDPTNLSDEDILRIGKDEFGRSFTRIKSKATRRKKVVDLIESGALTLAGDDGSKIFHEQIQQVLNPTNRRVFYRNQIMRKLRAITAKGCTQLRHAMELYPLAAELASKYGKKRMGIFADPIDDYCDRILANGFVRSSSQPLRGEQHAAIVSTLERLLLLLEDSRESARRSVLSGLKRQIANCKEALVASHIASTNTSRPGVEYLRNLAEIWNLGLSSKEQRRVVDALTTNAVRYCSQAVDAEMLSSNLKTFPPWCMEQIFIAFLVSRKLFVSKTELYQMKYTILDSRKHLQEHKWMDVLIAIDEMILRCSSTITTATTSKYVQMLQSLLSDEVET